mgnify:CR=1
MIPEGERVVETTRGSPDQVVIVSPSKLINKGQDIGFCLVEPYLPVIKPHLESIINPS